MQQNSRTFAIVSLAALLMLLMLPNLIWLLKGGGVIAFISGLLVSAILLTALFALFNRHIWIACLLLAPLALLAPIEIFYVALYGHPSSEEVIASVFATNSNETVEFFGRALNALILGELASFILALVAVWTTKRAALRWQNRSRPLILVAIAILPIAMALLAFVRVQGVNLRQRVSESVAAALSRLDDTIVPSFPFGAVIRLADYHRDWKDMQTHVAALSSFRFNASRKIVPNRRQIYVLVIGESSRRDRWQLFGYVRHTNPELSANQDIVPISNMVTSWPISVMAIPLIVTRKPIDSMQMSLDEPSILRAMQEAGFQTRWISNQMPLGKLDSPVSAIAVEAQQVTFMNHEAALTDSSFDEAMIKPLRDAIHESRNDLFIVLHMMGSHMLYDRRYPPSFKHFLPTFSDSAPEVDDQQRMNNSYDNTILYTDHVLAEVIRTLDSTDAISAMLFASDHGETLPTRTCSFAGHGVGSKYDFEIPALFWYSRGYASAYPAQMAAIRRNASQATLSGNIFESVVDMSGVTFPHHDPSWSLFSEKWQYHPRTINSYAKDVNFDEAHFDNKCEVVSSIGNP